MLKQLIDLPSLRVAVLLGGASGEREISLFSGEAVAAALADRGHRIVRIDPARTDLRTVDWPMFDAAFIALHGRFGEDGQLQSQFDSWGVPYTGSGAAASRLAFSKSAAKERFAACGVRTPQYVLIHEADSPADLRQAAETIGFPLVVKPDASGSSLGVTIVESAAALPAAAAACFAEGPFGLIERAIVGTEWTLGLIDDDPLPLIRIDAEGAFYDFAAKYEDCTTQYRFDVDLSPAILRELQTVAASAARAIGTAGIARVDLRLDGAGLAWVLEVNTVPGFTDHSLVPKAAARVGLDLGMLCERAIASCLAVHRERRHNREIVCVQPPSGRLRRAG